MFYVSALLLVFFCVMSCVFGITITILFIEIKSMCKKQTQILPQFNIINPIHSIAENQVNPNDIILNIKDSNNN